MSMNSALSLSFINFKYHSHRFHIYIYIYIYIYIIIYLQYVQHVGQKLFQREINAIGKPTSHAITNWDATRGTPLGQREPQETSLLRLKSK